MTLRRAKPFWAKKTGDAPFSFFADIYPSTWGVSFRKLRSTYTGSCCRVQRVSDSVVQDFGFVNNYVDVAGIEAFLGTSDGRLFRMYDQIGANAANDLRQENASISPLIAVAGVVNKNALGHVYADFTSTSMFMQNPLNNSDTTGTGNESLSMYSVWNSRDAVFSKGIGGVWTFGFLDDSTSYRGFVVSTSPSLAGFTNTLDGFLNARKINSIFYQPSTHLYVRRNGVDSVPLTPGSNFRNVTTFFYINRDVGGGLVYNSQFMELIKRRGDNGADRVAIENQINSFYNCF